jgi:serpin B
VLVLTNAVYFNAAWADAFSESATTDGAFVRADGSTVTVPMMRGPVASRIGRGEGWIAAELPYAGDQVSMVVLLPDDLDALEEGLDTDVLDEVLASLRSADVSVTMPRFEARSHFSLKDALSAMGMASAFEAADFSNLTTEGGLRIADVIHEGFVRVDEKGTEAAAATAVIVDRVSLPESIVLDGPFLFFIRDVETNALLFVGRIVDPST